MSRRKGWQLQKNAIASFLLVALPKKIRSRHGLQPHLPSIRDMAICVQADCVFLRILRSFRTSGSGLTVYIEPDRFRT
jgi:hypothetical protein